MSWSSLSGLPEGTGKGLILGAQTTLAVVALPGRSILYGFCCREMVRVVGVQKAEFDPAVIGCAPVVLRVTSGGPTFQ